LTGCKTVLTFNDEPVLKPKEGAKMMANSELRNGERFYFETPVLVEDNRTGYRYDGTMFNYSRGGMYLETDYAPRPSRKIRIKINNLPDTSAPKKYLAEVRWRQPLFDKKSSYSYGIGVKHF
jgi:hypothetical protein